MNLKVEVTCSSNGGCLNEELKSRDYGWKDKSQEVDFRSASSTRQAETSPDSRRGGRREAGAGTVL